MHVTCLALSEKMYASQNMNAQRTVSEAGLPKQNPPPPTSHIRLVQGGYEKAHERPS